MSATTVKDAGTPSQQGRISRPRLPARELLGTAVQAFRTRRLRAALSALGIAIGIGAMVAVVGVSASSEANLLAEINGLGTNLLTVAPGQSALGQQQVLPGTAVPMIGHMDNVLSDAAVYQVPGADVYRTPLVPSELSGGIGVDAAGENLPAVMGTHMLSGHFLDAVSDRYPEAVLGYQAAQVLQITQVSGNLMVYLGNTWFTVIGIMSSATLLGAVALLVGAIGIANIMVISVLERRGEIGLRRALGATRLHITIQFLTESALLAVLGGIAGLILGTGATWIYSQARNEPFVVPLYALIAAPAAGLVIGAIAGLYPATKAARLSPTEALRTA